ncbi:MAG: hypothetical protein H7X71_04115, partial [Chitinophagales bacterium]|nr:hypothetical protein [Chitinophagales bacterium]
AGNYDGFGTLTFSNGDRYEGAFKNNLRHGFGTFYFKDGIIQEGLWENDLFTGK